MRPNRLKSLAKFMIWLELCVATQLWVSEINSSGLHRWTCSRSSCIERCLGPAAWDFQSGTNICVKSWTEVYEQHLCICDFIVKTLSERNSNWRQATVPKVTLDVAQFTVHKADIGEQNKEEGQALTHCRGHWGPVPLLHSECYNKFYLLNCVYRPVHSPQVISQVLDRILICVLNEALQNVDLHLTQIMLVGKRFLHR